MDHYLELRRPMGLGVVPSRIPLSGEINPLVIGRGSRAHIFLYAGEHPSFVSREHAKLELINGKWTVADLESVNGMFFNSVKIEREQKRVLSPGDRVYFGNPQHSFFVEYEFVVVSRRAPSPATSSQSEMCGTDPEMTDATLRTTSPAYGEVYSSPDGSLSESSSYPYVSVEDIPDDIWSCRIFPFLNIQELYIASFTCNQWLKRARTCLDLAQVIRWRHPWLVDSLVKILERKSTVKYARQVSTIITEGCYKVRDEHVDRLAQLCGPHLRHIDLSGTPTVTARGMLSIARYCPNVRVLIVRGCKRVGARVGGSTWDWLTELAQNGSLEHCDLHCAGSSDEAVRNLAKLSPRLKRLDIGVMCTEGVTDEGLKEVAEHCPELAHLDLRGCKRVSNDGVTSIAMACGSKLKVLVLHSCDVGNDALRSIGTHCSMMETLDIHRCSTVNDEGIKTLVQGPAEIYKTLKHLDLSNLVITDAALRYIANSGIQLTTLDLRSCKMITGAGLIDLIKVTRASLRKLDLNGCMRLTPEDVAQVAVLCRGMLEVLEIGAKEDECESWTPDEVKRIKGLFDKRTIVHDSFDFPSLRDDASLLEQSSSSGNEFESFLPSLLREGSGAAAALTPAAPTPTPQLDVTLLLRMDGGEQRNESPPGPSNENDL